MTKKLYYFDIKGYAEGIRYLLHYGGIEFEDVRIKHEDYPKIKPTLNLPQGKMPVYVDGDKTLYQSQVIARYIARQLNLAPTDPWEEAKIDAILHTLTDLQPEVRATITETDPTKKEDLIKNLVEGTAHEQFSRFDKQLAENNGYFGGKLTWVDIMFVAFVDVTVDYFTLPMEKYPNVKALVAKVQNLKGIKEYLAKRT